MKFGALQLSGNLETYNIVRHPQPDEFQFVMNRNTFQIRTDWDWLQDGKFIERYDFPLIKRSKLFLVYRGVYDGVYDLAPADTVRGITRYDDKVGGPIEGNRVGSVQPDGSLREGLYSRYQDDSRDSLKFENRLREAYIDLNLADAPISFRIGRQQVIWGESDQFRLMDIWNPLDLTWHLQQEPFEKIRKPLWLVKTLWDIERLGPFSNAFVEVVWNPFDFQPGVKADFLPRPWGAPFPNPTRAGQVQLANINAPFPLLLTPLFDLQGTSVRDGDFEHNPQDATEIGARIHGVTPQGIEMTVNYLYGRSRSIGAFAGAPFGLKFDDLRFRGVGDSAFATPAPELGQFAGLGVGAVDIKARFIHPYTHIFGLTGNYFEADFTTAVLRFETAYQLGAAVQTIELDKRPLIKDAAGDPVTNPTSLEPCDPDDASLQAGCVHAPVGFDKRNLWSGMIGFDRPTWIRWLNNKTTWFISGQFFWSYVDGRADVLRASTAYTAGGSPYLANPNLGVYPTVGADGIGTWTSGPYAGLRERFQDGNYAGNSDNVHQWEILTTLAFTSFYRGGTIVPFIATAWDPVNRSFLSQLQLEYFYTNDFIITLQQKYYTDFGHSGDQNNRVSQDPWGVGGQLNRRDETGIKLTYQF
jgi:hypothetical protein